MQRETRFRDLEAAEFQAADRMPLPDRRPAVAAWRGAAAGTRMEQVPDEAAAGARILALDRDAKPAAPSGHDAIRAGRGERFDDSLDDLVRWMAGAQRHRPSRIPPYEGALLRHRP